MITHFHILIGGFTQKYSDATNGLCGLEYELLHKHGLGNGLSDVTYLPWYIDANDYAKRCWHFGDFRCAKPSKVQVVGYSYGGMTALNICRAFENLGVKVDRLCLIDPVKRRSLNPLGWLAAFNRWAELEVPANVRQCVWFYQKKNWPRSHTVKHDPSTNFTSLDLRLPHSSCDNSSIVRETVTEQAEDIHREH